MIINIVAVIKINKRWNRLIFGGVRETKSLFKSLTFFSACSSEFLESEQSVIHSLIFHSASSPGKEWHQQKVSPDRFPVTACMKHKITHVTWNVRTLNNCVCLIIFKQEMNRFNINILGVFETRWLNNGDFDSKEDMIIHAGRVKKEK